MWHVFVEFGGLVFWMVVAVVVLLELFLVSREKLAASFVVLALFAAIVTLFTSLNVVSLVSVSWRAILWWLGAYVAAGVAWSVVRWVLFALKRKNFFYDCKEEWRSLMASSGRQVPKDISGWAPNDKVEFFRYFVERWEKFIAGDDYDSRVSLSAFGRDHGGRQREYTSDEVADVSRKVLDRVMPKARNHKSKISVWLSFWPLSILCYFLEDFVVDAIKMLVRQVTKLLNGINALIFSGMKKDLGV